jgi:hypothetical protein
MLAILALALIITHKLHIGYKSVYRRIIGTIIHSVYAFDAVSPHTWGLSTSVEVFPSFGVILRSLE